MRSVYLFQYGPEAYLLIATETCEFVALIIIEKQAEISYIALGVANRLINDNACGRVAYDGPQCATCFLFVPLGLTLRQAVAADTEQAAFMWLALYVYKSTGVGKKKIKITRFIHCGNFRQVLIYFV
jgi:hypothetical protein